MKEIPLTRGKTALVDDEDFDYLNQWKWYAQKSPRNRGWYARRSVYGSGKHTSILMHTLLIKGEEVDHINRNGLDNRRENLRVATRLQNCGNQIARKRGYKGVYSVRSKWRVIVAGKHIGYFDSELEAARAYNDKALAHFGEFAYLNAV